MSGLYTVWTQPDGIYVTRATPYGQQFAVEYEGNVVWTSQPTPLVYRDEPAMDLLGKALGWQ